MTSTTSKRRRTAPFTAGGTIRLLHDSDVGTAVADLPVVRVTKLADGRHWRVTAQRRHESCPTVDVVVDSAGRDRDGYVVAESDTCTAVAS